MEYRPKRPDWKLVPMTEDHGKQICGWRYEGEYAVYNFGSWEEMVKDRIEFADPEIRRQQYYSMIDEHGDLHGFAQLFPMAGVTRLGLGMRPDLCGKGWGSHFVRIIAEAAKRQRPDHEIDLEVLTWNLRAIKAYEKAGFIRTHTYMRPTPEGPALFHCMVYDPSASFMTKTND